MRKDIAMRVHITTETYARLKTIGGRVGLGNPEAVLLAAVDLYDALTQTMQDAVKRISGSSAKSSHRGRSRPTSKCPDSDPSRPRARNAKARTSVPTRGG